MSLLGFLLLVLIAAVAGSLGQLLAGYTLGGCVISTLLGFVGAYLGVWIANQFGLPAIFAVNIEGQTFPVVWAVVGSAIFAAVVGLIFGRRYY